MKPQVNFQGSKGNINLEPLFPLKDKVVVVMGATGTGKSRLGIDLATRFPAEIVNSDKIQVFRGLDIATNKVTEEECTGIPHHLFGVVEPGSNFTATDFRISAAKAVESIVSQNRLPIIAGTTNPQTFQVNGKVENEEVMVLIDSGSTLNIINEAVASKLSLPIVRGTNLQVTVANGETIDCTGRCLGVTLLIQGYSVQADFYVLPVLSCEMILGVQWLRTLGTISIDFRQLKMEFTHLGQSHIIQGLQQSDFEEELLQLSGMGGFFSHMVSSHAMLTEFAHVFATAHDHQICLQPHHELVSVRPYEEFVEVMMAK